jgi:NAD(P)H-nitrite reductase large subunit
MVSGHAYGRRCVPSKPVGEWCRFGTQDSTGLGNIKAEKMTWGSWMRTSSNCCIGLSAPIAPGVNQDLGICVESGYELSVGQSAAFICATLISCARSKPKKRRFIAAFIQLYREDAILIVPRGLSASAWTISGPYRRDAEGHNCKNASSTPSLYKWTRGADEAAHENT